MTRSRLLALLAAGAFAGGCGSAQLDSMEAQLADIQRQVLAIQKQSSSKEEVAQLQRDAAEQARNLLKAQADIRQELQSVSALIEQLEGKLEDTNQRLAQLSQQIAATNQTLKALRPGETPMGSGEPPSAGAADPDSLYRNAYNDYLRGSYDLAILGFRQYLETFGGTDLADNASYWIGESYYRQRKFEDAIREFDLVVSQYPESDKVPSALLRKGYAFLELGEQSKGVVQLQNVIRRYPRSDEANLARQQLATLGIDPAQPGK